MGSQFNKTAKQQKTMGFGFLTPFDIHFQKSPPNGAHNANIYTTEGSPSNRAHKTLNRFRGKHAQIMMPKDTRSGAGSEMVIWSLEAQPCRSQRILKPGTPPQVSSKFIKRPVQRTRSEGGHSVSGSPAPQISENPRLSRRPVSGNSAAQISENPEAQHATPIY